MTSQKTNSDTPEDAADEHKVLDMTNSKGHGFHLIRFNGINIFPLPDVLLKGEKGIDKLKKLKEAELEANDVIICAFPKCGTHWVWEALEMLRGGVAKYQHEVKETRMLEFIFKEGLEAIPSPRILNTHLPLRMLPNQVTDRKIKCVQIMRNPKDVCVSDFHHLRNMLPPVGFEGDFAEFTELFLEGKVPFGSYHDYLLDWNKEITEAADLPVHCMYYEDMKKDPVKCIRQLADFIEVTVTNELCEDIAEACSFQKMKKADETKTGIPFEHWKEGSEGTFYRKGEVGDWKNWFTVAESERFDQIWNEKMENSGISFTYSLKLLCYLSQFIQKNKNLMAL